MLGTKLDLFNGTTVLEEVSSMRKAMRELGNLFLLLHPIMS